MNLDLKSINDESFWKLYWEVVKEYDNRLRKYSKEILPAYENILNSPKSFLVGELEVAVFWDGTEIKSGWRTLRPGFSLLREGAFINLNESELEEDVKKKINLLKKELEEEVENFTNSIKLQSSYLGLDFQELITSLKVSRACNE